MKNLKTIIRTTGLFLLVIFVLQVGGITCANDIYYVVPSDLQHASYTTQADRAADMEKSRDAGLPAGDLLYECQCPCHLNFSSIETPAVSSYPVTESPLVQLTSISIQTLSREILQPPKI